MNIEDLVGQEGLLTVGEAAQMARVTKATVRMWVSRDQVVSTMIGGRRLIGQQSLLDCELARREVPGWGGSRGRQLTDT